MTLKLISARIKNFKSLGDVDLNFRDLTILVGANASGKSNCLGALRFLSKLLKDQEFPSLNYMDSILRVGEKQIFYELTIEDDEDNNDKIQYSLVLSISENNTLINREYLLVNKIEVINIIDGQGIVKDENGENSLPYNFSEGDGLTLADVGKYGHKPITKKLSSYIKDWKFYDVNPESVRRNSRMTKLDMFYKYFLDDETIPSLCTNASEVKEVLQYWAEHDKNKFDEVSQELYDCLKIKLQLVEDVEPLITVIEEDGKKIPLSKQVKSHLDQMASNKWGTEIEIWIAARIFKVNIDVFTLPRDPRTKEPLKTGKIMREGKIQFLPLQQLNITENTALPTIRLFNASGASATGIHYQVLPSSISKDDFLLQNK